MTSINISHASLVKKAEEWLKLIGCSAIMLETSAVTQHGEKPDAIGWYNGNSILIECKKSRNDFLADKLKHFRINPEKGMGSHRLYLCPDGLIVEKELPEGWGLLYSSVIHNNVQRIICPKGNCSWGDGPFKNKRCMDSEIRLLLSFIRRKL